MTEHHTVAALPQEYEEEPLRLWAQDRARAFWRSWYENDPAAPSSASLADAMTTQDDVDELAAVILAAYNAGRVSISCRRCTECAGENHHWIEESDEKTGWCGFICKHCPARAEMCDDCDGAVEPGHDCEGVQSDG